MHKASRAPQGCQENRGPLDLMDQRVIQGLKVMWDRLVWWEDGDRMDPKAQKGNWEKMETEAVMADLDLL